MQEQWNIRFIRTRNIIQINVPLEHDTHFLHGIQLLDKDSLKLLLCGFNKSIKRTLVLINRGNDTEDAVDVHKRLLLSRKERNSAICSNRGGPEGHHAT